MKAFKKILRCVGILVLVVVIVFAALLAFLSLTEYKPQDREKVPVQGKSAAEKAELGVPYTAVTWNIGYGALGDNADFFMDGGKMVETATKERVMQNISGIMEAVSVMQPDFVLFQEVDQDSSRSHHINEKEQIAESLSEMSNVFANNFKAAFVPYPVPPIGKVDSGLLTCSSAGIQEAERVQLPIPFAWPIRMANLKRCLLISRIPVADTEKELVLLNLHLEAYDDGEGKIEQTKRLLSILKQEVEKGNYVIAGGDFNQVFSQAQGIYPVLPGLWTPGIIETGEFEEAGFSMLMDASVPTCRSLDRPYKGAEKDAFQYYLIDGFVVSGNISVSSVQTIQEDYTCADHNPVKMEFVLVKE